MVTLLACLKAPSRDPLFRHSRANLAAGGFRSVRRGIACRNADEGTVREVIEKIVAERRS